MEPKDCIGWVRFEGKRSRGSPLRCRSNKQSLSDGKTFSDNGRLYIHRFGKKKMIMPSFLSDTSKFYLCVVSEYHMTLHFVKINHVAIVFSFLNIRILVFVIPSFQIFTFFCHFTFKFLYFSFLNIIVWYYFCISTQNHIPQTKMPTVSCKQHHQHIKKAPQMTHPNSIKVDPRNPIITRNKWTTYFFNSPHREHLFS